MYVGIGDRRREGTRVIPLSPLRLLPFLLSWGLVGSQRRKEEMSITPPPPFLLLQFAICVVEEEGSRRERKWQNWQISDAATATLRHPPPPKKKVEQKSALFFFFLFDQREIGTCGDWCGFYARKGGGSAVWPHVACPKTPFPISGSGKPFGQEGRETMWDLPKAASPFFLYPTVFLVPKLIQRQANTERKTYYTIAYFKGSIIYGPLHLYSISSSIFVESRTSRPITPFPLYCLSVFLACSNEH